MAESVEPGRTSNAFPIRVIACPHCRRLTRDFRSRWGLQDWILHTDLARVSNTSMEQHPIAKCPHCGQCFWRSEAETLGSLHPDRLSQSFELFGEERILQTNTPYATDLEQEILNGLPRIRSEIWKIHLMAWRRLNDGLRFESADSRTATAMDKPIRLYVADALLSKMPNRHPLTRLLRIDILRQIGRFADARKSAETLLGGLGIVKKLGEAVSLHRNALYGRMIARQIELVERQDRLPRRFDLTVTDVLLYHELEKEMLASVVDDERLRPPANPSAALRRRVETSGWTCHNCGRGGRAGPDFSFDGRVICRHCGWPQ